MVLNLCYAPESVMNEQMNERTNKQTSQPEAICPPTFFKVGGIKMVNGRYYEYSNHCSIGKSIK